MGFQSGPQKASRTGGGGGGLFGFHSLIRRKQVDSIHVKSSHGGHQLAKELSITHLISIGNFNFFFFEK